jgi:glycine betaine/choline ABC-type transport system substrate-binding protein
MTRSLRLILAALVAVVLAFGAAACGSDDDDDGGGGGGSGGGGGGGGETASAAIKKDPANSGKKITIGSKNFTEQFVLGEIYAQALQAAGYDVTKELNLGSEQIAYKALKAGQIDAYPEYTGTSLTSFFGVKTADVPRDADQAYALAKKKYAEEGITELPRTKFENTYKLSTTKQKQKDLLKGATTISEVAALPNASELRIVGFPECRQRQDCYLGLKAKYGWSPKFISTESKYEPLDADQADVSMGSFSTDGELTLDKYAVLEDDKKLFPPYHISLGMRDEALKRIGPAGREVIVAVQEPLTVEAMQELNSRVDLDKKEPAEVATEYLTEEGFIK